MNLVSPGDTNACNWSKTMKSKRSFSRLKIRLANHTNASNAAIKSMSAINSSTDNNAILANVFFTDTRILLIILQNKRNNCLCGNLYEKRKKLCQIKMAFNKAFLVTVVWRSITTGDLFPGLTLVGLSNRTLFCIEKRIIFK